MPVPHELVDLLDLHAAWKRVREDISTNRTFVHHPFEIELIDSDLDGWLKSLAESLRTERYHPSVAYICEIPKAKGHIRPGALLTAPDRVVYAACVGACLPAIKKALGWSQGKVDFGYRLTRKQNDPEWIQNQFRGWSDFRKESLEQAQGNKFVVVADLAAFYENIDLSLLISDVRKLGPAPEVVTQLTSCLNRWAQVPNRGVPQGQTASDILAKLYLNDIDQNLQSTGHMHLRYVDDIRIFCRSEVDARKALMVLTRMLRAKGLNLQAAKTEILPSGVAVQKIEGVAPIIREIGRKYVDQIAQEFGGDPYMSIPEAEAIIGKDIDDAPIEVLRDAYKAHFLDRSAKFNSTLFRFVIKRLGKYKDGIALRQCFTFLRAHPEETHTILEYFENVGITHSMQDKLAKFLTSRIAVYAYQKYQVLDWISRSSAVPTPELLRVARQLAFNMAEPRYLRAVCRKVLGDFGSTADLELLLQSYQEITDPMEQAEVMCSLKRMERGKRNTFLSRAENDGQLNRMAARLVRAALVQ